MTLALAPLLAHSAGLGQLTVRSALGRPLNAEIEILALQPGELDTLSVRMASSEALRRAGIEPSPVLSGIRLAIERRGSGAVVRLTSTQPINEPFLDVLVELQWAAGRLAREYTFLLDPPEFGGPRVIAAAPVAPKPVARAPEPVAPATPREAPAPTPPAAAPAAVVAAPVPAPVPAPAPAPSPAPETVATAPIIAPPVPPPAPPAEPAAPAPDTTPVKPQPVLEEKPLLEPKPQAEPPAVPVPSDAEAARRYEVVQGDTLSEIAVRNLPGGVTLNQMLIALYRENPEAFIRENINLVRAGRILNIPDQQAAAAIDRAEANQLFVAHLADFEEYRRTVAARAAQRLAGPSVSERAAAGPIERKPEPAVPAQPKDELKLSKVDPKKPSAAATRAAREDDLAARERALQESQSRVADLEKNVADLQKLLELKNQQLAELEKRAAAAPAAKPAAPKPVPAPAPAPTAKPAAPAAPPPVQVAQAPKPAAAPAKPAAEAPKPAAAPAPTATAPAAAPTPPAPAAAPPKPAAAPAKPAPKPAAAPPAPSFIDEFTDNPLALGGLGAVVLLLAGYGTWAWRRKKASQVKFQDSVLGPTSSAAGASSVFGPAGASQAAGPTSVVLPSVSQGSVPGVETDEVDAIAEADVYMAYGRDTQAEEILVEALNKDPSRVAVYGKLIEIYANRRDAKAFEQAALKLQGVTGGAGAEWDKALALGRALDPENALYGGPGRAAAAAAPALAAAAGAPTLDIDLDAGAAQAAAPDLTLGAPGAEAAPEAGATSIDFDLGAGPAGAEAGDFSASGTLIVESPDAKAAAAGLDIDLGAVEAKPDAGTLDFELPSVPAAGEPAGAPAAAAAADAGLDFDLKLDVEPAKEEAVAAPAVDLSAISLDLGEAGGAAPASDDPKWQEVATKLDLAKAYQEMGDKDGASELLNEVLKEGDNAQKSQAQQLLAALA